MTTKSEQTQVGIAAVAEVASKSLATSARANHAPSAEASHLAALASERLTAFMSERGLAEPELDRIIGMLREAQNFGHVAYLRQHGSEMDYQAIGKKVTARFRTPSGKWRR